MPLTPARLLSKVRTVLQARDKVFTEPQYLYRIPIFTKTLRACPICQGAAESHARNAFTPLDKCRDCGHIFARVQPGARILNKTYDGLRFWQDDKAHQGITDMAPGPHWDDFINARFSVLEDMGLIPEDRTIDVFEIGCSEGILLHEFTKRGHTAAGCEMNRAIVEASRRTIGVDITHTRFEAIDLPPQSQDLVLAYHVVEHLADPLAVFRRIHRVLRPDGGVLFEVPAGDEEFHNTFHLHFFTEESLRRLLSPFFEVVQLRENRFSDAYGQEIRSLYAAGKGPLENAVG